MAKLDANVSVGSTTAVIGALVLGLLRLNEQASVETVGGFHQGQKRL
jgi:hypothetical protein